VKALKNEIISTLLFIELLLEIKQRTMAPTTTLYLLIALISFVASTNAAYLSITYSDASCTASNRVAFYYDTRASLTCVPSSCAATGDGNYYEVRCPASLSVIDTTTFAMVNYHLSFTGCTGETAVYGGKVINLCENISILT
jgi:hypothetical protein